MNKPRSIEELLHDLRPIAGGAEEDDSKDDSTEDTNDEPDKGGDDKPDMGETKAEADKWKSLSRKHEREAKAALKRLKDIEDADKTEVQRATDKLTDAEKRAEQAELRALRLEVAAAKGLTPGQAKRLVGSTQEELEADADELLESFKPDDKSSKGRPTGKPRENLRGGGEPDEEPDETDPRKLAARVTMY